MLHRFLLAGAVAVALAAPAAAAEYTLDPVHTEARFTATHLALTKVHGQIPVTAGAVTTGATDVPTAISATLDVSRLNTENERRDAELRSADWFETAKYPTMTFVSTKITGTPQAFTAVGNLTFHGVTKPATLEVKYVGTMTDGRNRRHLGYSATTSFDRREWGLNWGNMTGGALIAGYDVTVDLEVDAIAK